MDGYNEKRNHKIRLKKNKLVLKCITVNFNKTNVFIPVMYIKIICRKCPNFGYQVNMQSNVPSLPVSCYFYIEAIGSFY